MINFKEPFSGLHGEINGATYMIMQREQDINAAIMDLVYAAEAGKNIKDDTVQRLIFWKHNLDGLTKAEKNEIIKKAEEKLRW